MLLIRALLLTALTVLTACAVAKQNMVPVVQLGHSAAAVAIAFSPDSRFVLSGSDDRTMKLWEVSTGREIRTFRGIDSNVTAMAYLYLSSFLEQHPLTLRSLWPPSIKCSGIAWLLVIGNVVSSTRHMQS
jgi:WD40 repeat protein